MDVKLWISVTSHLSPSAWFLGRKLIKSLTQEDPTQNNWKIVEWYVKYQIKTKPVESRPNSFSVSQRLIPW